MQRFITNSALLIIGFYILFAGLAFIMVVLDWATQEKVMEWLTKAGLVALILFVLGVIMSAIVSFASKKS